MRESLLASRPRLLGQWTLMGPLHEDPHHHNPPPPHHHHHENGDVEPHLLIHDTRAAIPEASSGAFFAFTYSILSNIITYILVELSKLLMLPKYNH